MKTLIRDVMILVCLPALLGSASALAVYVALKSAEPQYACDTITSVERDIESGAQIVQTAKGLYITAPGSVNLGKAVCRRVGE